MSKNMIRPFPAERLIALVLLFCFATLTGFPAALHAHEWDGGLASGDCAPCHFAQHTSGTETQAPSADPPPRIEPFTEKSVENDGVLLVPLRISRSPPAGF